MARLTPYNGYQTTGQPFHDWWDKFSKSAKNSGMIAASGTYVGTGASLEFAANGSLEELYLGEYVEVGFYPAVVFLFKGGNGAAEGPTLDSNVFVHIAAPPQTTRDQIEELYNDNVDFFNAVAERNSYNGKDPDGRKVAKGLGYNQDGRRFESERSQIISTDKGFLIWAYTYPSSSPSSGDIELEWCEDGLTYTYVALGYIGEIFESGPYPGWQTTDGKHNRLREWMRNVFGVLEDSLVQVDFGQYTGNGTYPRTLPINGSPKFFMVYGLTTDNTPEISNGSIVQQTWKRTMFMQGLTNTTNQKLIQSTVDNSVILDAALSTDNKNTNNVLYEYISLSTSPLSAGIVNAAQDNDFIFQKLSQINLGQMFTFLHSPESPNPPAKVITIPFKWKVILLFGCYHNNSDNGRYVRGVVSQTNQANRKYHYVKRNSTTPSNYDKVFEANSDVPAWDSTSITLDGEWIAGDGEPISQYALIALA